MAEPKMAKSDMPLGRVMTFQANGKEDTARLVLNKSFKIHLGTDY